MIEFLGLAPSNLQCNYVHGVTNTILKTGKKYDARYRLSDQKRGTLNGTQTVVASGTFEQQWGLDGTGNWKTLSMEATEAIERLAKMNAEGGSELPNGT